MSEMPCSTSRGSANDAQVLADSVLAILADSPARLLIPALLEDADALTGCSATGGRRALTDITLERQEDGRLLQLARLALIVAESGRCGGPRASRSVIPAWSCGWQGPAVRSGVWRPAAWASG
jgi:hypothetical protein